MEIRSLGGGGGGRGGTSKIYNYPNKKSRHCCFRHHAAAGPVHP
jgi:hypothetical protein